MPPLAEDTPLSFRYRGERPLPTTAVPGQFVVLGTGELHLGLSDGSHLQIGGGNSEMIDTTELEETIENLTNLIGSSSD